MYDSLGNLTYETTDGNKFTDYRYNILNQMTYKTSDSNGSEYYTYEYDNRGNLIKENLTKAGKVSVEGAYVYNEMNKLSMGTNNIGETSTYVYNGLSYLVQNVWEIKKNAYGYQEIQPTAVVAGEVVVDTATGKKDSKEKKAAEVVLADPELNKTTTVTKDFVLDYTRNLQDVLYETESGNLNYRYGYGLQRLSATISPIDNAAGAIVENGVVKLYYHQDYLGTTDYLTSDATGKVVSWTMYNEWGEITHNAVLKCGIRELDLVKNYTGYEYDPVLGQYYAKNRMYDAENRRFTQLDPAMDGDNWYAYVGNNPVNCVDLLGLAYIVRERTMVRDTSRRGMPVYEYTGYYNLEPEDSASVWQKIALTPVPWGGTLGSLSEKNNGIVGGTSASNLVQSVGIDSVQQAAELAAERAKQFKKLVPVLGTAYSIYEDINAIDMASKDKIIFELFNITGISTRSTDFEYLNNIDIKSHAYINAQQDYFFDKVTDCYTLYEIDTLLISAAKISQEKYDRTYKSIMLQFVNDWSNTKEHAYNYMKHKEYFEKNILPYYRDRLLMLYEDFNNFVVN